jgi:hypothetical protein
VKKKHRRIYYNTVEAEARILGGLPVLVYGRVHPPEPDVGVDYPTPEIDDIAFLSDHPITDAMWKRISESELEDCEDALLRASEYF